MKKLSIMLFIALSMTTFSFFDKIKSEIQLKLEDAPRFENKKKTKNGKTTAKPITAAKKTTAKTTGTAKKTTAKTTATTKKKTTKKQTSFV